MATTYALLFTGLAAQQATATWNFFDNFGTPNYSQNECSDKQKGGFNWSDLLDGDSVNNYGDFDFSGGWKCANSFGKRDVLSKRTFGNKCIKNTVGKDKPASFGCNKRGFSITHMDISSEFDAEIELHYTMEDGSKCKQLGSCSAGGSTLQNTQCGGAKSVDVYLGAHYKGDKDSCEIGFHNIGFDCNPGTPYTTPPLPQIPATSTPVKASSSAVKASSSAVKASSSAVKASSSAVKASSSVVKSVATPPASSKPVATPTGGECKGESCYPASTPKTTTSAIKTTETPSKSVPVSSGAPFGNSSAPAYTPQTSAPVVVSSMATPKPQSSSAVVPPTSESSAAPGCGYGESCDESSVAASSTKTPEAATSSAAPKPSSPSYPTGSSPSYPTGSSPSYPTGSSPPPLNITDVVPKCMNSWLQISAAGCKDNTDSNCYCVKPEFTKNVIDCITARCGNDDAISKALQYFIGICADHVPKNPQIIGDCPSYIPLNPTPAAPTGGAYSPVAPPAGGKSSAVPSLSAPTGGAYSPVAPPAGGKSSAVISPSAPAAASSAPANSPAVTPPAAGAPPAVTPPAAAAPPESTPCTTLTYGTTTITVPQFTGAASAFTIVPKGALFGAVLAFFAL
ncbi:adhesin Mad1 [Pyrenophora seminiperda CCB06]|uniref:Adhesin Mad1 n=1 Tax=Pyrenophora seminiperda CCB06 TaxID=1302712 RepID=A0A3M7MAR9_9PLEO|nr:adhesin Mad1 [Pyrenophora seminiperda CCB06]